MRFRQWFGAAALWMLCTVGLLTGWDALVRHEAFRPAKLLLRVGVFGLAAMLLGLLAGRMQGRRR